MKPSCCARLKTPAALQGRFKRPGMWSSWSKGPPGWGRPDAGAGLAATAKGPCHGDAQRLPNSITGTGRRYSDRSSVENGVHRHAAPLEDVDPIGHEAKRSLSVSMSQLLCTHAGDADPAPDPRIPAQHPGLGEERPQSHSGAKRRDVAEILEHVLFADQADARASIVLVMVWPLQRFEHEDAFGMVAAARGGAGQR